MKSRLFRTLTGAIAAILLGAVLTSFPLPTSVEKATAAVGADFQAGNIISDQNFFNASSMSEGDIQNFFQSKTCTPRDGVSCLKDYTVTTPTTPAVGAGHCGQYTGGTNEPASRVVWKVAQACGISPAVLIVLMQKEQSLLTNPSAYGYARAMGWGCPDSGPGGTANCDANFFGLFNQVYKSAWQFRQYTLYPVSIPGGGTRQYRIGNIFVQYHPNVACGGQNVSILNQATANLYLYTPYVPNAAALGNMYGVGDGCSSYGNRNFWRMYSDWFGSPTSWPGTPVGQLESMSTSLGTISLKGWAVDPSSWGSQLAVDVQVDSTWHQLAANNSRSSVGSQFPEAGPNHGFEGSVPATKGAHSVCVYVQNVGTGSPLSLGCQTVVVPDESPSGKFTELYSTPAGFYVAGWAVDPDALNRSVVMDVQIDGQWQAWPADVPSQAASNAYPGAGLNHGFSKIVAASIGSHTICVYLRNLNLGSAASLGCRTINVLDTPAQGSLQTLTAGNAAVSLTGWAVDPDAVTAQLTIDVQINSAWYVLPATASSATALTSFPSAGANHGFVGTFPVANGVNTVCAYARNAIAGGPNGALGCKTVSVSGGTGIGPGSPQGAVTTVTGGQGSISLGGWAVDGDSSSAAVKVDVQVDGRWLLLDANESDASAQAKFPGVGVNHGFSKVIPVSAGAQTICVYLQNIGQGTPSSLGCHTVTVAASPVDGGPPTGEILSAVGGNGSIALSGWAVDPDVLTQAVKVDIQIDSKWAQWNADQSYAGASSEFPGAGSNHGFSGELSVDAGKHTICVYLQNVGQGGPVSLGCRVITTTAATAQGGSPSGELLSVVGGAGSIALTGWAIDPDVLSQAVQVDIQIGSRWVQLSADQSYPAGESKVPGAGVNHGFGGTLPVGAGNHTLCVYLQNVGQGSPVSLGCRVVTTTAASVQGSPTGELLSAVGGAGSIALSGWAIDPDILSGAVKIDVQVDSQWMLWTADQSYPDGDAKVPGAGVNHGFSGTVPVSAGTHTVCLYLQNVGGGGAASLGCRAIKTT
ncbi:hypothetical protein [Cryobacterium serini]|uniref:Hemagglutinin n=1 Tax=Cryobacterium serini TaxID=1259201 RepID=A0A4V3IWN1_9MICO|nr:hypothetical protein [Cryobacterium serini]TFD86272.1 hypothetical protein E3T51_14240 [Cryobacterium serini]